MNLRLKKREPLIPSISFVCYELTLLNLLPDVSFYLAHRRFWRGPTSFGESRLSVRTLRSVSLFKSSGRRPPRHIHNPSELMLFTRRDGQRIGSVFILFRKIRPGS
jgi:hypothetical protein